VTSAPHYRSNLRDTYFNLFEVLDIGRTSLGHAPFVPMDEASAREALATFEKLCSTEIAASFCEGDRSPPTIDAEGNVTLPEGIKRSLEKYFEGDWHMLEIPEERGGFSAPPTIVWSGFELTVGANAGMAFYLLNACIARVIDRLGTEPQRQRFVTNILERNWGTAMVLTEADAGSDVGAARAKARHVEGDLWEIEGTKRFITAGESDAFENIIHMVLARPDASVTGTKGLSMFIVPKIWVNEDGSLGERNNVVCTKLEKKMGLKSSTTCEMSYGIDGPTRGFLVGDKHDGIRQMFHIIEYARMAVGIKSMATLSTAYKNALEYTKERVQGADLARANDKSSPRVRIIQHPDVRRMLMLQKSHVEGMRALILFTAWTQDQVEIAGGHSSPAAKEHDRLNDMLLPLVKGYCSDKVYELLAVSLQCFGGSGYVQDYPIEQYIRDQKIDTLYEGTTHIQALDLFFRKIARDGGATLQGLLGRIRVSLTENIGGDALTEERQALAKALGDVEGIFMAMMGKVGESVYHAGLQGNRILFALAELIMGWLLVRHAAIALDKKGREGVSSDDVAFYEGKIASARFFCREVLPGLTLSRKLIEQSRLDLMSVPEEAF
jgi:alkylation response protein AidB-like acyl-CoA dehydrogenase